ncbi:MAG: hypothetical protein V4536_08915 [Pseudomonadota bacterium]
MLPSPTLILGTILALILTFGGGFMAGDLHRGGVDKKDQAIEVAKANDSARQIEQKVAGAQNAITKSTLKEKDAIEQKRIEFNSGLNPVGLRQSSPQLSTSPEAGFGIRGQTLRFSRSDAEFLNNFASECQVIELERNEVIQKYEALN